MASEVWLLLKADGSPQGKRPAHMLSTLPWGGPDTPDKLADQAFPDDAPHRVVHLVEAGTIDPAVAAVVRAAAEEADKMHHCDCATCSAVRDLKLNQLRACGVPVEDSDDAS